VERERKGERVEREARDAQCGGRSVRWIAGRESG
jgi:hypothetical protein